MLLTLKMEAGAYESRNIGVSRNGKKARHGFSPSPFRKNRTLLTFLFVPREIHIGFLTSSTIK